MLDKYILDGKTPMRCNDLLAWAAWMQTANRHVALDEIDECMVSTVFLGLDHRHFGKGPPLLFETIAFGPAESRIILGSRRLIRPDICSMARYSTWAEAERGHQTILSEVQAYCLDTAMKADEAILAIAAKQ